MSVISNILVMKLTPLKLHGLQEVRNDRLPPLVDG